VSDTGDNPAIGFLKRIAPAAGQGGGLEAMTAPGAAPEMLAPSVPAPDALQPVVDRTLAKIAENRALDSHESFALEAIIIPDKRPVIDVLSGNQFRTDHALWQHFNGGPAHDRIAAAVPAVGRVELPGHPSLAYGGTGFVVGRNLLMTNRHIAELFASGLGTRNLAFLPDRRAGVDFEQRADGGSFPLAVSRVAMIHPYWDMALLEVEGLPASIEPLRLATQASGDVPDVAVIGYPAFDPRNDIAVQNQVFRGIYNVKRIMPGKLTGREQTQSFGKLVFASTHDSSTLGGASASAVVNAGNGTVAALHFGGIYLRTNYGVPADLLARDGRVIDAGVRFEGTPRRESGPWDGWWDQSEAAQAAATTVTVPASYAATQAQGTGNRIRLTLPLTVTIEMEPPVVAGGGGPAPAPPPAGGDNVVPIEAPVADYRDRKGYDAAFLGAPVGLPEVRAAAADVLRFELDGKTETELRYEHFSVVMNRPRRLCFFSAVNIDGGQSRKSPRTGWRLDPRIPTAQQIIQECYGNPPRFSRGHMTRREDPVWGDETAAARGNADSMHVTNTVPQMQAFNSPIWLALEDYALEHAREDEMKISVFTGPYFRADDPVLYGVQVPVSFWKIIAFIHDVSGKLCATGYEMSQKASLPAPSTEYVFGEFRSRQLGIATQTSIRSIEARSGLSFGNLADFDPKSGITEAAGGGDGLLDQLEQIRFV
jgi:endonuclease G